MKLQDEICRYLGKNNPENKLTAQEAQNIITQNRKHPNFIDSEEFLIGAEVTTDGASKTRYFQIFYFEGRTDQLFIQLTPMHCFRSGHLAVNQDGEISLLDDTFKNYRSSITFSFDPETRTLKAVADMNIEAEERLSSRCIKGLVGLGLFATAAAITYTVAYTAMNDEQNRFQNH
jgi:hypothetical protein